MRSDKKWWCYGKLPRDKATLISLDFLSNFYTLKETQQAADVLTEAGSAELKMKVVGICELQMIHQA